jgi:hypothetical protein
LYHHRPDRNDSFGAPFVHDRLLPIVQANIQEICSVIIQNLPFPAASFPYTTTPTSDEDFRYKDQPSSVDVSIALANSGARQIELIQQRNEAASM